MIEVMPAHPMYAGSSLGISKDINDNNTSKDTDMNMQSRTPILPDIVQSKGKRGVDFKMEDEVSVQNLDAVDNEMDTQPIM